MLALETTDDWAWSCVVVAASDTDYFTADATAADAYTSVTAFVAWLNDPARAWHGSRAWTWSWLRNTDGGALLMLACTGDFLFLGTAAPLAFATASAGPTLTATASAAGTWAPTIRIAVRRHQRLLGDGDCGGGNTVRPGVPGLSGFKPAIDALGTAADACRLTSMLAAASTPRRAVVWQVHTSSWRRYALGEVGRSASETMYRFTLAVAGEVA